ncbi:MAG: hypothetical protein K9L30_04440 [Desulfobacterales bacterium]|nr:hypothetical protein [Desulfobacterales bacterium]
MNDENKIWKEIGTVRAHECMPDGKIHIYAMMQYLQDAAAKHAQSLGFGFDDLSNKACYWVLTNIKIQITDLPDWNTQFTIRTWPSGFNRLKATRNFLGYDAQGIEFLRAASEWMVIGKDTGRPLNLLELDLGLLKNGDRALDEGIKRLKPASDLKWIQKITVPYSALDVNGHVNNTEYVKWIFDALHAEKKIDRKVKTFQIAYIAEVFEGDELNIYIENSVSKTMILNLVAKKTADDKPAFLARMMC